jgi:AbrB family looped-hinge helix DNA binding protein
MDYAGSGIVTRQGQITIPKSIRKKIGIEIGSSLDFYFNNDLIIIRPKHEPKEIFEDLAEKTRKRFKEKGLKRSDIDKEIRAHRKRVK